MEEFKVIMKAGPSMGLKFVAQVTKTLTDPDEMQIMLRNARYMPAMYMHMRMPASGRGAPRGK